MKWRRREKRGCEARGLRFIDLDNPEDLALIDYVKKCKTHLATCCGQSVMDLLGLYEVAGATLHDLCQITGANYTQVKRLYDKHLEDDGVKLDFVSLVFAYDIELRDSKVEWVYLDTVDAPYRHAITAYTMHLMHTDPEVKEATDDIMQELFPGLFNSSYIIDPKGVARKIHKKPNLKIVH